MNSLTSFIKTPNIYPLLKINKPSISIIRTLKEKQKNDEIYKIIFDNNDNYKIKKIIKRIILYLFIICMIKYNVFILITFLFFIKLKK